MYVLVLLDKIPNPVLYLRGRMSAVIIWGGLLLLILISGHFFLVSRKNRRHLAELQEVSAETRNNRRRFLQRLDHELKNPLTAIRAGLINISSEPLSEYVEREVTAIKSQALRIGQLVADLRKIATLEIMTLEKTDVNMADLLESVVEIIKNRNHIERKKLTLITPNAPWPLPVIQGDPDLLLLAVHNLIENALKFTQPGDTIEVRASEKGEQIVIEVADTGLGIPEHELDRVWEELYRGSRARGVPGSGLGLPLVRAIVEKHGGQVTLRSKPDQGSVFGLILPIQGSLD
jgi:two-component system OmpR family sensor kinase